MTNQNEEIELETVEAEYWIDQKKALEELEKSPAFQKVILDGFFKERALDQVSLLANEYVKKNGLRGEIMEQLVAISSLQDHFATIKNLGAIAEDELVDAETAGIEG